ncbi:hypothetical protein HZA75_01670 [Candidatus Roizmanbacteria bacterium]|nr:hypothetical protein [Candidatus Roizmanbacteria bacterium]
MDKSQLFEFYEILSLILPGSVMLYGLGKLFPQFMLFSTGSNFSAGEFGIFVIIAYAVGHIVQVFGGFVEFVWKHLRGDPMDWIQNGSKKPLIFDHQVEKLEAKIAKQLGMSSEEFKLKNLSRKEWSNMIKQMRIAVEIYGHTERLDKFQAIYMMCRGLIAALFLLSLFSFFRTSPESWYLPYLLFGLAGILFYRMARFELNSVRELFIQFLQMQTSDKHN